MCLLTEGILGVVLVSLGDGSPEDGDRLEDSASMFEDLGAQIAALDPDGAWRGAAAQAYGDQLLAHSRHATLMADLDRLVAELMSSQAEANKKAREAVYADMWVVGMCFATCLSTEAYTPESALVTFRFAVVICGLLLIGLTVVLAIELGGATSRNASNVQAAMQRVTDMMAALPSKSDTISGSTNMASPNGTSLVADWVSEFPLAGETTPTPHHIPDLGSAFAELPGAPEFHLATEAGPGFPDFGAPDVHIPPLTGTPTPPHPGDLRDVSSLLASLPSMAQRSNTWSPLPNTATQHAQTISTLARQHAPQSVSPANHRTTDAADSPDTVGAAAGGIGGQKAPLDTQTCPAEQRRPSLV
ncbi:EspA/EspE family type VII secretion system effector [Mycobacterium marinum]|uniref:EspA/EspE family type VII secretion system effector n=1 Tax=Mycobacterium marinum TaxID=1781 RepID=UPI0023585558|nr:EspA/EspE family type VII secretion system effector [Mycobacterium marinum]MDC9002838.1 EspA/EspE family type VII secretion system effector [Mycobacterium marinum]